MKGEEARKLRLRRAVFATSLLAVATVVTLCAQGTVRYPGDVNTDKVIDVSDAVLLSRYISEDPEARLTRSGVENADVNGDGLTDSGDVIMLVRQIARFEPMPPNPYETEDPEGTNVTTAVSVTTTFAVTETTATEQTDPETTVTEATAEETTVTETTETEPVVTEPVKPELTADTVPYPLGVSISVLTGETQPNEMLTVSYDIGNIIFAIFANDPLDTTIAIAYQDDIVGYYKFCESYTVPAGYRVSEYRDYFGLSEDERSQPGAGKLYAILALREDVSIDFPHLSQRNDLSVLSKLNYYGANGIRANYGLNCFVWNDDLARIARMHSTDMADNNFVSHTSSDGTTRKDRMLNAGIDYHYGGENVDYGYVDIFDALNGWFNSADHRNNLLNSNYTNLGVGFAYNENSEYRYYGTQDFCSFFD